MLQVLSKLDEGPTRHLQQHFRQHFRQHYLLEDLLFSAHDDDPDLALQLQAEREQQSTWTRLEPIRWRLRKPCVMGIAMC